MPLNRPYGGSLVNLLAGPDRALELRAAASGWASWQLSLRQLCELELLINGAFSPLRGFLGEADYHSVCSRMRMHDGTFWPIPIMLDISDAMARRLRIGDSLALRDSEGAMVAALQVEQLWQPDRSEEARILFGSASLAHLEAAQMLERSHPWYVSGQLEALELPRHYDYLGLRHTPAELRREFTRVRWERVAAFVPPNLIERPHYDCTLRAARAADSKLLIQAPAGAAEAGNLDHYTRIRCYQAVMRQYPPEFARLSLAPMAARTMGGRNALCQAIVARNCGCSHFLAGRGAGRQLLLRHADELGIEIVPVECSLDEVDTPLASGQLQQWLEEGRELPAWLVFPEVAHELRSRYRPRHRQGFTVFFTGLSGAGKSSVANVLLIKLLELGERPVTLLDGDRVRQQLSSELGFSRQHRDLNIRRIGWVAAEIAKHGGVAICAPIAPYDAVRKEVRQMAQASGGFVLVHMAAPLEVCEERDRKGLYAKARSGLLPQFTGISDPYEAPRDAEVVIDSSRMGPEQAAQEILFYLQKEGYLAAGRTMAARSSA